jgi:hypothetical protein
VPLVPPRPGAVDCRQNQENREENREEMSDNEALRRAYFGLK